MGDEGLELPPFSPGNTAVATQGGAESGAVHLTLGRKELLVTEASLPDLDRLLSAWPQLSPEIRRSILALVDVGLASAVSPESGASPTVTMP